MKKMIAVGVMASFLLVGCGSSAEDNTPESGTVGTKEKDYGSNTEREFRAPDEFYDYGDYDRVKVIRLQDTTCVLYHYGDSSSTGGGAAIACDFPVAPGTTIPVP